MEDERAAAGSPGVLGRELTEADKLVLIDRAIELCREAELAPVVVATRARHHIVGIIRREWKSFLVVGVITWAVALVLNLLLIAFRYGAVVDHRAPVVARGNAGGAAVLWTVLTGLVTSIVGYRVRVGAARFWAEVREFPVLLRFAAVVEKRRTATHLLWGFAGTMVVVLTLAPALLATLAVGTVFFLAGPARAIVVATSTFVWRGLGQRVASLRTTPPPPVAVLLGSCGTGLAMLIAAFTEGRTARLGMAAIAAVVAVVLARRATIVAGIVILVALPVGGILRGPSAPAEAAPPAKTGIIKGTVKDARGKGVVGVEVAANGEPGTASEVTAGDDGAFEIADVPFGTYRVVPRDPNDDRVRFTPKYQDVELGASAEVYFTVDAAGGGGGGDEATTTVPNSATTARTTTTTVPATTTPKQPRTLSSGSTVVADFVVKAATRDLKPAPSQSVAQAAAAGSAAARPVTTTSPPRKPTPPSNTIPRPPPFTLPAAPIAADCRDVHDRQCYPKAGFLEFNLGRRILKVGEKVSASVSFDLVYNEEADLKCQARLASGGVERCPVYSWSWAPPAGMIEVGGSPSKPTKKHVAVGSRFYDTVTCESGKEIASATCEFVATGPTNGWVTSAGAVLEGFASGNFRDGDFFAVIPSDVAVIEGHIRDEEGEPVPGVTIHMDGPQKYTSVTDNSGWYFHVVEPGDYDIYADVRPALGFGKPKVLPTKHETKLTVPKGGTAAPADLDVVGPRPCTGGLFSRLACALDPKVAGLAALLLLPIVPGGMAAQGLAKGLGDLASPAGDLLKKLPKLPKLPNPTEPLPSGVSDPKPPDLHKYGRMTMDNYMDVRNKIQTDWDQYLRDSNPGKTWDEILATHDRVKEANHLYGRWVARDYAAKPLAIGEDLKLTVGGYFDLVGRDLDTGDMFERMKFLPEVAVVGLMDTVFGPRNPNEGNYWDIFGMTGGMMKVAADQVRTDGIFAPIPLAYKYASSIVNTLSGDAGKYTAVLQATLHMSEAERDKYLRDNAADVPYFGWMYEYSKAVDSGDKKAIARVSLDLAQRVTGVFDGRPKEGYFASAAERRLHLASVEKAAAAQAFRDRFGHDPGPETLAGAAATGRPRASKGTAGDDATVGAGTKPSAWDRAVSRPEHEVMDVRSKASKVAAPMITPEMQQRRKLLLERAAASKNGMKVTIEDAELLGVDRKIVLEQTDRFLRHSEGKASKGMRTDYKLGGETALAASKLRTERPDIWTGKWNPVSDKGWVPGELALVSDADRRRFAANPPLPGETVNYTPRVLTPGELAGLPEEVLAQYNARHKDASAWDHYTDANNAKTIDYSDKATVDRYGTMFVREDAGSPVAKAQFWRDPDDLRIYVRYQTKDGVWHPPKRQASDVDTISHTAGVGGRLTDQEADILQRKASMGQLGEGDSGKWAQSMLTKDPAGHWVIKNPKNQDMLVKAIDTLTKGEKDLVLRQDLDGLRLMKVKFPELDNLKVAARAIDAQGGWDEKTRASLASWGVFNP